MKDVRFYLEFPTKTAKKKSGKAHTGHAGNVFALFLNDPHRPEGIGALLEYPNSPVCGTGTSWEYLRTRTKRIPEKLAREIHPMLFARLDMA